MNTTILTENSHPQSTGGHRTGSSLNMPPKSWKDYVPRYVSLYYVDYNENLDSREDLQERCIRRNSLHPLEEQVWEWYAEQEHDNLQGYLADIRKAMEADGKADEYARNEEGIKDLLYERNSIDPTDELIDNSAVTNMFYSLGVEIEGYVYGSNARKESEAISLRKIRRALKLKKGQFADELHELLANAPYGGELRIYFNAIFSRLLTKDTGNDFKRIRFYGDVIVAIADSRNGAGYHVRLPTDITLPFCRDNLFTDSQVHYSYANEICGMLNSWCDSTRWETGMKPLKSTMRKSRMSEHQKQEALYEKRFREGGCTLGDMNHKRHRNTYYINSFPCGTKCPHCGTFWID